MVGAIRFSVPLEPIDREVDLSQANFSVPGVFSDKTFSEFIEEFVTPNFEEDLGKTLEEFFRESEDFQDENPGDSLQKNSLSTPTNDSLVGAVSVGDASIDFDESGFSDLDRNDDVIFFNTDNLETVAIETDEFVFDAFSTFLDSTNDKSTQEIAIENFTDTESGNTI
jgi:hypothetical protein